MYLFQISKTGDPFSQDDSINALEVFRCLSPDELRFVVFTYDKGSPYRFIQEEQRVVKVCEDLCIEQPEWEPVKKAIEKMAELQDDEIFSQEETFTEKLLQVKTAVKTTKPTLENAKQLKDLMNLQVEISKQASEIRKQVNDLLANRRKEGELRAGRKKSFFADNIREIKKKTNG